MRVLRRTATTMLATTLAILAVGPGCASSGREIDTKRVEQLQTGTTTEADVRRVFGAPQERITRSNGGRTWVYRSSQSENVASSTLRIVSRAVLRVDPGVSSRTTKNQTLVIQFDSDGVVSEYSLSEGRDTRNSVR